MGAETEETLRGRLGMLDPLAGGDAGAEHLESKRKESSGA